MAIDPNRLTLSSIYIASFPTRLRQPLNMESPLEPALQICDTRDVGKKLLRSRSQLGKSAEGKPRFSGGIVTIW
ncbi:hypothetical protein TNCT_450431 [Trichonephila clavata]|uniref:Uncharacterized protein n=1 Tax=Trichonephila clavata TaxID=2740835 RepID=A0A8X6FC11_TRICU|nr:hypothetical protein TNCT_450431 [Trichonephila clavata]